MNYSGSVAAALVGTAAVCWSSAAVAIGSSAAADLARPQAPTSNPTPVKIKGKGVFQGVLVTGSKHRKGRTEVGSQDSPKKSHPKKRKPVSTTFERPPLKNPGQTRLKQGVRLNVGMCGRVQPDGAVPGPNWCQPVVPGQPDRPQGTTPPPVVRPRPEDVTWDQVFTESKNVLFKKLTVYVQPKDKTLVNMDTIVYTDKTGVLTYTVEILGFPVIVQATPSKYTWSFGDRTSKSTYSPGAPYPSKEITHKYLMRGNVSLSVTVEYAASFQVAGGPIQYVGPVPVTGPATPLQVREAVPVLVEPPR